jgi:hypothetical protein
VPVLVGYAVGTLLRHALLALVPGVVVCVLLARWFASTETGDVRLGFWGSLWYPAIFVFAPYLIGALLGSHAFSSGEERILERERRELERLRQAGRRTSVPTRRATGR